jgi:hypothetical protein
MYSFEVDKHAGILLVEDGTDADDDLEFLLVDGRLGSFRWTSAFHSVNYTNNFIYLNQVTIKIRDHQMYESGFFLKERGRFQGALIWNGD